MFDVDIYIISVIVFYNLLYFLISNPMKPTNASPSIHIKLVPFNLEAWHLAWDAHSFHPCTEGRRNRLWWCGGCHRMVRGPRVALGWFVESAMEDENFNVCVFLVLYLSFTWHFGWEISNSDFWWLVAPFPLRLKTILCPNPNPLGSKCTPESQRGWGWNDIRTMMTSMSLLKCSGPERTVSDAKSCFAMKPRCLVSLVFCPCDKLIIRFTKNACELFFQLNNIKSYQSTLH